MAQTVKRLPAKWATQVWSLAREDPLEKEMATHSITLAWKIPWTEEPTVHGITKSQTRLSDFTFTLYIIYNWIKHTVTILGKDVVVLRYHFPGVLSMGFPRQEHWSGLPFPPPGGRCSVAQSCPTLCDPMNRSTPGLPVHHQLLESTQTHVHWVSDAIQLSHPLSSPSPPAFNLSQHQGLFRWVSSLHHMVKEDQLFLETAWITQQRPRGHNSRDRVQKELK